MEWQELAMTALRALVVYVFMLVTLRLLGKRAVGNFTAFDLLVALMLGEIVDEMIYGDVTLAQGAVVVAAIAALEYANEWLSFSSPRFARLVGGDPTVVVQDGQLQAAGMRAERISEAEIASHLREQGIDDLAEVKCARLEADGRLSVIKHEWARPARRGDFQRNQAAGEPKQ